MTVFYLRNSVYKTATTATTHVIPVPANNAGDLMIMIQANSQLETTPDPAGWTIVDNIGAANLRGLFAWKISSGSEPANYTWTYASANGLIAYTSVFSGVEINAPINASSVLESTTAQSVTGTSITTTKPTYKFCCDVARDDVVTAFTASTSDATVTEQYDDHIAFGSSGFGSFGYFGVKLEPAGTVAGVSTTLSTTTPTHRKSWVIGITAAPDLGVWNINQQAMNRSTRW